MLRIKDPKVTIPYYRNNYGFQLLHKYDFPEWKFSLYFMGILDLERAKSWPESGSAEAGNELWKLGYGESTLEFTHNWGTEDDASFAVNNGNVEPHRPTYMQPAPSWKPTACASRKSPTRAA